MSVQSVQILPGDNLVVLKSLIEKGIMVDSVVTDPPYGLAFMNNRWDYDVPSVEFWKLVLGVLKPGGYVLSFGGTRTYHRMVVALEDGGFEIRDQLIWMYGTGFPKAKNALKPAMEPVVLARKPLVGTVVENVGTFGTGALNIDGCRTPISEDDKKEFERLVGFNNTQSIGGDGLYAGGETMDRSEYDGSKGRWPSNVMMDSEAGLMVGDPARFFYCPKASTKERRGSKHPTVKPIALMRYLCRLVTPVGGVVLDPYAGSGTTGEAAYLEGFSPLLIEMDETFVADIEKRMGEVVAENPAKASLDELFA